MLPELSQLVMRCLEKDPAHRWQTVGDTIRPLEDLASSELQDFLSDVAVEAYYELGEIRLRMGDLESAESLFRQAHELGRDPVPGLALLVLGRAYRACGNREDAELELQAAGASFERLGAEADAKSTAELLES